MRVILPSRTKHSPGPLLCQVDHSTGQLKVIMLDKVQYEVHVNCLKPNFRKVNQKTDIGTSVKTIITEVMPFLNKVNMTEE